MSNIVSELYKSIDEGREGKHIGISTGLPKLDNWIGGIQKRTYYLISGLSGAGKTSLALYSFIYKPLCEHINDDDYLVVYFSLEMSVNKLLAKLLSLHLWDEYNVVVSYKDLMSWKEPMNDWTYEYVIKAREWLEKVTKHLIIYDKTLNRDSFYHLMMEIFNKRGSWEDLGHRKVYTPDNPNLTVVGVIDHIGLVTPVKGATKKEEIDSVSAYAVTLRERCGASFVVLQQENRNSANMDRRKMDMTECSLEDLKDSGSTGNDCEIAIGVYFPLKHHLKTCHDYPIICNEDIDGWEGLRDKYRGIVISKNRDGDSDVYDSVNFHGIIGTFTELPKAKEITDWRPYLSLSASSTSKLNNSNENSEKSQQTTTSQKKDDFYEFNFE